MLKLVLIATVLATMLWSRVALLRVSGCRPRMRPAEIRAAGASNSFRLTEAQYRNSIADTLARIRGCVRFEALIRPARAAGDPPR